MTSAPQPQEPLHKDDYFAPLINCDCPACKDARDDYNAAIRKEVLDALGTRLNSWISAMEILDSKHPSPLRKGIIMAYRDVEEWERQMRKPLRGETMTTPAPQPQEEV